MIRSHLNMLVQLARVDGVVVKEEIDLIKKIGKANGMSSEDISESFDDPSLIEEMDDLTDDLRYDYMYNVVQLMKVDGRIYKEEIKFCARIASNLGYEEGVLREMMLKIYSDPHITTDKETLKSTIQQYLKK
ncbi:MAG: TerB family tellurite resistance protein [Ekhidna sp.]